MGTLYSYVLCFRKEELWNVLRTIIAMSDNFTIADDLLSLEPEKETSPLRSITDFPYDSGDEIKFDITLLFDYTEELKEWQREYNTDYSIKNNKIVLGLLWSSIFIGNEFISVEFTAPTGDMGFLMNQTETIRNTFKQMLENHRGICGMLQCGGDDEVLIWKDGKSYEYQYEIIDEIHNPDERVEFIRSIKIE